MGEGSGEADISENEPQAGYFRRTAPATTIGPQTELVQSVPRSGLAKQEVIDRQTILDNSQTTALSGGSDHENLGQRL